MSMNPKQLSPDEEEEERKSFQIIINTFKMYRYVAAIPLYFYR